MENVQSKTKKLLGLAILVALIIVLQTFASGIHFGTFSPTLSLIPIIIGAILFGPLEGAFLGLVFGVIVTISVISGAEQFSMLMFNQNPVMTVLICLVKGAAAGFFPGLFYKLFGEKNSFTGVLCAAVTAPIANTGIFCIGMLTVFRNLLSDASEAAGGGNTVLFLLTVFVGINFVFELIFDAVLAPAVFRIITIINKK